MRATFKASAFLAGAGFLAAAMMSGAALAHDPANADLSGTWVAYATEPSGRLGALSPKLTEAGKAAVAAFQAEYGKDHPEAGWYCVGTGMPYAMTSLAAYPIEFLQTPGRLTMLAEIEQQVRRVYIDGREVPKDYPRTRIGYSVGHWEGDTLVVETSNFKDWPLGSAPRSEASKITERLTVTTQDKVDVPNTGFVSAIPPLNDRVLIDEMTIEDSLYYEEPVTVTIYFQTVSDELTLEYDCTVDLWMQAMEDHKDGQAE